MCESGEITMDINQAGFRGKGKGTFQKHPQERGGGQGKGGVSGFVDAEFEGHSACKLVSLVVCGDVDGVDSAFHVHLHVGGHIQELHGHEGLCVVHLGQRRRVRDQAQGNLAPSSRSLLSLRSHLPQGLP